MIVALAALADLVALTVSWPAGVVIGAVTALLALRQWYDTNWAAYRAWSVLAAEKLVDRVLS